MSFQRKKYDIPIGTRFGKWTVVGPPVESKYRRADGKSHAWRVRFPCVCDCGISRLVWTKSLERDNPDCGCIQADIFRKRVTKHGYSVRADHRRLYQIWVNMRVRCHGKNPDPNYHGRGISVCREWRDSFEVFRDWAYSSGYTDKLTIDRFPDNDGNYEPGNCRWATRSQQSRNMRNSINLTWEGRTMNIKDWAEELGMSYCTIYERVRTGWTVEDTLFRREIRKPRRHH